MRWASYTKTAQKLSFSNNTQRMHRHQIEMKMKSQHKWTLQVWGTFASQSNPVVPSRYVSPSPSTLTSYEVEATLVKDQPSGPIYDAVTVENYHQLCPKWKRHHATSLVKGLIMIAMVVVVGELVTSRNCDAGDKRSIINNFPKSTNDTLYILHLSHWLLDMPDQAHYCDASGNGNTPGSQYYMIYSAPSTCSRI